MGAAPLIAARRGLEPKIHPLGAPLLEHGFPQELYRALAWGRRGSAASCPFAQAARRYGTIAELGIRSRPTSTLTRRRASPTGSVPPASRPLPRLSETAEGPRRNPQRLMNTPHHL
jgi:hypothetical protein